MVVGVAVDHPAGQADQSRGDEARDAIVHAVEQGATTGVCDRVAMPLEHLGRAHDVPVELAVGVRVVEAVQGTGQATQHGTEVAAQLRAGGRDVGEQRAGQVLEQPDEMAVDLDDLESGARPAYALHRHPGRIGQGGSRQLRLQHLAGLQAVGHLEHRQAAVVGGDAEDAVTLAGQARRGGHDAVDLTHYPFGIGGRGGGGVVEQRHASHPRPRRP